MSCSFLLAGCFVAELKSSMSLLTGVLRAQELDVLGSLARGHNGCRSSLSRVGDRALPVGSRGPGWCQAMWLVSRVGQFFDEEEIANH